MQKAPATVLPQLQAFGLQAHSGGGSDVISRHGSIFVTWGESRPISAALCGGGSSRTGLGSPVAVAEYRREGARLLEVVTNSTAAKAFPTNDAHNTPAIVIGHDGAHPPDGRGAPPLPIPLPARAPTHSVAANGWFAPDRLYQLATLIYTDDDGESWSYATPSSFEVPTHYTPLAQGVGDMDGNRLVDRVAAFWDQGLRLRTLYSTTADKSAPEPHGTWGPDGQGVLSGPFAVGDYDGDGRDDLALLFTREGQVTVRTKLSRRRGEVGGATTGLGDELTVERTSAADLVLVWGDEWITYDSEWADHPEYQVERLWLNAFKWLTPENECQVPMATATSSSSARRRRMAGASRSARRSPRGTGRFDLAAAKGELSGDLDTLRVADVDGDGLGDLVWTEPRAGALSVRVQLGEEP